MVFIDRIPGLWRSRNANFSRCFGIKPTDRMPNENHRKEETNQNDNTFLLF